MNYILHTCGYFRKSILLFKRRFTIQMDCFLPMSSVLVKHIYLLANYLNITNASGGMTGIGRHFTICSSILPVLGELKNGQLFLPLGRGGMMIQ